MLRLSRKCAHPAYNLCLQFIRRTCARESPFSAVAVAYSPCARAPRSRPLPLAPLTFRLASLSPSPSLRTIRRQRAAVMSHPLARPGTRLQIGAATGHAGRNRCGWWRPAPAALPRQRRCPGMGADPAAPRGRRARRARRSESERASVFVRIAFQCLVSRGRVGAAPAAQGCPSRPQPQACGPALLLLRVQARSPPPSMRTRCSRLPARAPRHGRGRGAAPGHWGTWS